MNRNDICILCRRADSHEKLGAWLVGDAVRAVHLECWLASHEQRTPPSESRDDSSPPPWPHGGGQASSR